MTTITSYAKTPEPLNPAADQLYHAVCSVDGRWRNFGPIGAGGSEEAPPGFVGAGCAEVAGTLMLVGVGVDGELYHASRDDDGEWQPFAGLRDEWIEGGPREFYTAACCGGRGALHLVGLGSDARPYHTVRLPDGSWQGHFEVIDGELLGGPEKFGAVSCAVAGETLHVVALDQSGQAHHTARDGEGNWHQFRSLGQLYDAPARFVAVDCAAVWGGSLHLLGVGGNGELYHTIRWPDGTWQRYFGVLGGQQHGVVPRFALGVACTHVGHDLGLIAICSDHRLFHSTRQPDGTWRGSMWFGEQQLRDWPVEFFDVSCASTGDALHLIGGTWQGGFA
jgi:hypothetical protein